MSIKATQIDFLIAGFENAKGGTVTAYAAGTTDLKTIWLDRDKQTIADNPYTLNASRGAAQLYADGIYKFVIKDSTGQVITGGTLDNIAFGLSDGPWLDVATYSDLTAAVTAIGATETTLLIDGNTTLTGNTTIPTTLHLLPTDKATINQGAYTLTINSQFSHPPRQIFTGSGAVTFGSKAVDYTRPEWWGIDGTSDEVQIQKAVDSLTSGAVLLSGAYSIGWTDATYQTAVNLKDNVSIIGIPGNSVTCSYAGGNDTIAFWINGKSNVKIDGVKIVSGGLLVISGSSNDIEVNGNKIDGYQGSNLTGYGIRVRGNSKKVQITNNHVNDYYQGVYIYPDGESIPNDITVTGNTFNQDHAGTANWPVGVYVVEGDNITVTGNTFRNIRPGGSDPTKQGYGFYEGDGRIGYVGTITVTGNTFSFSYEECTAILYQYSNAITITGNTIYQIATSPIGIAGVGDTGTRAEIVGNILNQCGMQVGSPGDCLTITGNSIYDPDGYGIYVTSGKSATISGNTVIKASNSGIRASNLTTCTITGNTVIDANEAGNANGGAADNSGINTYGTYDAIIIGNVTIATNAKMHYGINLVNNTAGKFLCENNYITGAVTAPIYGGYTVIPTAGLWNSGEHVWSQNPTAGNPPGWVCIQRLDTAIKTQANAGSTAIDVDSTTGILAADKVGITLDNGSIHWTYLDSVTDGDTFVIHDAIPASRHAAVDAVVYSFRFKAMANLAA